MKRRIYLFINLIFSGLGHANAQTGKLYHTNNDLSSSLINQLFQDKKGFIWIGTEFGLNKYDGYRFTNYIHKADDLTTIKNNYVRTLFETSHQKLLVGCIDGLMEYNQETNSFKEIPLIRNKKQVYPHVSQICELNNGEVWLSTIGQGVFRYDSSQKKGYFIDDLMNRLDYYYYNNIYEDSEYNIWIGTENNGLIFYSPKTDEIQLFKYPEINDNNISAIIENNEGELLIGTRIKGLSRFDKEKRTFIPVKHPSDKDLSIYCLAKVDNQVLVGTDGQGLKRYNQVSKSLEDIGYNNSPIDFSEGKIHSILQDQNKNLWIGLFQKGIVLIPKQTNPFLYYGNKSIYNNPIGQSCVMSIFEDRNSHLWVGTDNEGLFELNSKGERVKQYKPDGTQNAVANTIMAIFEDSEDNLWLGSYTNGVAKLNRKTGKCEYPLSIAAEKIFSITEDNHKNLYIATYGAGFYKYNLLTKQLNHYESSKDEKNDLQRNELVNDWISYIYCDSDGLIWLGHHKGVSCFNPKTESFINFKETNTLITNRVGYVIYEDKNNNIWAGTTDGLYCFNKKTEKLVRYSTHEGLPNNVICGIAEDNNGNLWISTYMGVSKLYPNMNRFINYYASDGLQGNEFTHGAFTKDNKGNIYFGGTHGISFFNPLTINPISIDSKVRITDFYVWGEPVYKGKKSGNKPIIYHSVYDANLFQLSYHDNTFTLVFSTLEYNNLENIAYQYKIEELGNTWSITEPGENRVTYNNLPAGKYTFVVRAVNHGEYSKVYSTKIIIFPPWYQTWWAYTIYIFLFILLIIGIFQIARSKINHKREMMKREHAEELNEAKLQFFMNISHEIRTPMTLIINPLEKLMSETNNTLQKDTYSMIYRNAQRILRLINQLMDIRKLEKGQMSLTYQKTDVVAFIKDVMLTFDYMAKKKDITFSFDHTIEQLDAWIDYNNFDKILMNLLSNAFKYTPNGGKIDVRLSTGNNPNNSYALRSYFEISVIDNGIGIDKKEIDRIFERFYQIKNDITQSTSGTGIGLHLCKSLVELHHGEITVENNREQSGSCFTIRIPLGFAHLKENEIDTNILSNFNAQQSIINQSYSAIESTETEFNEVKKKTKSNYHILIIEDEADIREYLKQQLSDDYKIKTCSNGKEAYDSILINPPHLILSDVMMPEMDGFTLCRKVKQNININHIPIVLLTAKSRSEDKVEGMEIGADAYCVKPFNIEILKSTISNLIQNRHLLQTKFSGAQEQDDKLTKIEVKTADELLMEKIMKIINTDIANPTLNVETLANQVGLSRVHIYRKLKELTNMSARDFIKNIRLKQAAALLKERDLTISDVAYATGFATLSHFSASFKELYGMSPTEYKQNYYGEVPTKTTVEEVK